MKGGAGEEVTGPNWDSSGQPKTWGLRMSSASEFSESKPTQSSSNFLKFVFCWKCLLFIEFFSCWTPWWVFILILRRYSILSFSDKLSVLESTSLNTVWHRPPFLDYRSREILWNYVTHGKPLTLPLFWWAQSIKIHNSCSEPNQVQPALQTDFRGRVLLHTFASSGGATAQRLHSAFLAVKASVFPILAANAEMPRSAGNCDYTHFIFYILKPQGISSGEQSPIS